MTLTGQYGRDPVPRCVRNCNMGKEMEHKPVQYARHRVREWDDSAKQGESTASHEEMLHIMPDD